MPSVPESIVNLYQWITYLTPVWLILLAIFFKPLKRMITKEKSRLNDIENKLNKVQKDINERKTISKALLHHDIFQTARTAIKQGYITESGLENLEQLYEPYVELGGNGTAHRLYEQCKQLPHKMED